MSRFLGHGLVVRHLRETTGCGGLEELQPIDENRKYDFNYQQVNILPRTVEVLPVSRTAYFNMHFHTFFFIQGDILHLQCSYRTTGPSYQEVTLVSMKVRRSSITLV